MKKGLRPRRQRRFLKLALNGPRPYEEGIKTVESHQAERLIRTDPDLMKKGLRQLVEAELLGPFRTDPDLMKKGLRRPEWVRIARQSLNGPRPYEEGIKTCQHAMLSIRH